MINSNNLALTLVATTLHLVACSDSNDNSRLTLSGTGGSHSVSGSGGRASGGASSLSKGGNSSVSCQLGGYITASTTWAPSAACPNGYDVTDSVEVSGAGTSLVIKPGTKLRFAAGTELTVATSASLVAVGTKDAPVTFTGWQELPGAWGGISIESGSIENEISNAIVEYGGQTDVLSANLLVWYDQQPPRLKLSNTQIRYSKRFGLALSDDATLAQFDNNTITKNESGAARVVATSVDQLKGSGNQFIDNGAHNIVRLETNSGYLVNQDVTWPNLAPAIYRVTGVNGTDGDQIFVTHHLTIEPGATFEFVGGSGIDVRNGSSGLSAIGTTDAPIVFRGVDGSGWSGIGFCESSWSSNALEEVQIANAAGPTYAQSICGANRSSNNASVLLGYIDPANSSVLRMKNVRFTGPNNGEVDIQVNGPSTLRQEGTNSGTGANGALALESF